MNTEDNSYIVQDITQEASSVRTYTFAYGMADFNFTPGQFVVANIPEMKGVQGALTLSSSPLNKDEFTITVKRTGVFGTAFYDEVECGTMLRLRKPGGIFKLIDHVSQPICFIGRDYAITAARSFYHYLSDLKATRQFNLFHEITTNDEVVFNRDFESGRLKNFKRHLLLAKGKPSAASTECARFTGSEIANLVPDYTQAAFYCAGEGVDVLHYRAVLEKLSKPPAACYFERWS